MKSMFSVPFPFPLSAHSPARESARARRRRACELAIAGDICDALAVVGEVATVRALRRERALELAVAECENLPSPDCRRDRCRARRRWRGSHRLLLFFQEHVSSPLFCSATPDDSDPNQGQTVRSEGWLGFGPR